MSDITRSPKLGEFSGRERWYQAHRVDINPHTEWEFTLAMSMEHAAKVFAESANIDCDKRSVQIDVRGLNEKKSYRVRSATHVTYFAEEV